MKIFISHSSKNARYGSALVKLLRGIGIDHDKIIFTSDVSYGIPLGSNIFHWLKDRISEKPFVIYLLSPEYYSSVACLNEMGAAWVVENQHATIFTPKFDINSPNFRNGAIDPREIGIYINDQDRILEFIDLIINNFKVSINTVLINKQCREFLQEVEEIYSTENKSKLPSETYLDRTVDVSMTFKNQSEHKLGNEKSEAHSLGQVQVPFSQPEIKTPSPRSARTKQTPTERYFQDLSDGKLIDEEVLIIYYASDTAHCNLGVGWKASHEVERIRNWEDLNKLSNLLSERYDKAIDRLGLRNLTRVSEYTSNGNARQVTLVEEMQKILLDLPHSFLDRCDEITSRSVESRDKNNEDELPF